MIGSYYGLLSESETLKEKNMFVQANGNNGGKAGATSGFSITPTSNSYYSVSAANCQCISMNNLHVLSYTINCTTPNGNVWEKIADLSPTGVTLQPPIQASNGTLFIKVISTGLYAFKGTANTEYRGQIVYYSAS